MFCVFADQVTSHHLNQWWLSLLSGYLQLWKHNTVTLCINGCFFSPELTYMNYKNCFLWISYLLPSVHPKSNHRSSSFPCHTKPILALRRYIARVSRPYTCLGNGAMHLVYSARSHYMKHDSPRGINAYRLPCNIFRLYTQNFVIDDIFDTIYEKSNVESQYRGF